MAHKSSIKFKVKQKKGAGRAAKIKAKFKMVPYIGNEAEDLRRQRDSLQRELDSLKVKLKCEIKQ